VAVVPIFAAMGRTVLAISARAAATVVYKLNPNLVATATRRVMVALGLKRHLIAVGQPRGRIVTARPNRMAMTNILTPPIDATVEIETVTFDYGPILGVGVTLSSPVITVSIDTFLSTATDPNPSSRIVGIPQVVSSLATKATGAAVAVLFGNGIAGVVYIIQCVANATDGQVLSLYTHFQAKQPD